MSSEEKKNINHAIIERGKIISADNGAYIIRSFDRDGIESLPLRPLNEQAVFVVGESVCYLCFHDGTGRIL